MTGQRECDKLKNKESGGQTLVQTPETADFPAMPQSAIDAGIVDHVLSVKGILEFF